MLDYIIVLFASETAAYTIIKLLFFLVNRILKEYENSELISRKAKVGRIDILGDNENIKKIEVKQDMYFEIQYNTEEI